MSKTVDVPFSEPYYYTTPSPYYTKSHLDFAKKVRDFVTKKLLPYSNKYDSQKTFPISLHEEAYKAGIYSVTFPTKYSGQILPDWDYFHFLIYHDEIARCGNGGLVAGLFIALQIGLSPIINSNSEYLKKKYVPDICQGKKTIALAVTEPSGGSDVSRIKAYAIIDKNDNNYYIINGEKYFITNGMRADYFTTAVVTDMDTSKKLHDRISFMLIPRNTKGVFCSKMNTQGWWSSNTAYINFVNVRIHKSHVIGQLNKGWLSIMNNFNHERFMMSVHMNRYSRICINESIKYARERKTFKNKLINYQIIKNKIITMIRKVEKTHSLLENIAYMTNNNVNNKILAGYVAIAKVQSSKTMEYCAREAIQIFGGRGYLQKGRGSMVERIFREVRVNAIGGGSEEILMNLAAKMAKL